MFRLLSEPHSITEFLKMDGFAVNAESGFFRELSRRCVTATAIAESHATTRRRRNTNEIRVQFVRSGNRHEIRKSRICEGDKKGANNYSVFHWITPFKFLSTVLTIQGRRRKRLVYVLPLHRDR